MRKPKQEPWWKFWHKNSGFGGGLFLFILIVTMFAMAKWMIG